MQQNDLKNLRESAIEDFFLSTGRSPTAFVTAQQVAATGIRGLSSLRGDKDKKDAPLPVVRVGGRDLYRFSDWLRLYIAKQNTRRQLSLRKMAAVTRNLSSTPNHRKCAAKASESHV